MVAGECSVLSCVFRSRLFGFLPDWLISSTSCWLLGLLPGCVFITRRCKPDRTDTEMRIDDLHHQGMGGDGYHCKPITDTHTHTDLHKHTHTHTDRCKADKHVMCRDAQWAMIYSRKAASHRTNVLCSVWSLQYSGHCSVCVLSELYLHTADPDYSCVPWRRRETCLCYGAKWNLAGRI